MKVNNQVAVWKEDKAVFTDPTPLGRIATAPHVGGSMGAGAGS